MKIHKSLPFLVFLAASILLIASPVPAHATAIDVACGAKPLANAIRIANSNPSADTLELSEDCSYLLKTVDNTDPSYGPNGLPIITSEIIINGHGAAITRANKGGVPAFRLFQIASGAVLTLNNLSVGGGSTPGDGGAVLNQNGTLHLNSVVILASSAGGKGGGVDNDGFGTLTVTDSTFTRNHGSNGGAVYSFGPLDITGTYLSLNSAASGAGLYVDGGLVKVSNSTFGQNGATGSGGAIVDYSPLVMTVSSSSFQENNGSGGGAIYDGGQMVVTNSFFEGNTATYGGAIYAAEPLELLNSTLSNNSASAQGGAIYHGYGDLTLVNSTIFANRAATDGGAFYNEAGTLTITNSTLSNNEASGKGAGIFNNNEYPGAVILANTILANNTPGANCFNKGTLTDNGGNLRFPQTDTSCVGTFGDPHLGALKFNGGLTRTLALEAGSAALDAGQDSVCSSVPVNNLDQRGLTRPQGAHCDIGAYEQGPATDLSISATASPNPVALNSDLTFAVYIQNHGPSAAGNLVFDDQVPANTTFQSFAAAGWSCTTPSIGAVGAVHCTRSNLNPDTGVDLTLTVHVNVPLPSGTILSHTANISTATVDLGPSPNAHTVNVCAGLPPGPQLRSPGDRTKSKPKRVRLDWDSATCATTYTVKVKQDSKKGPLIQEKTDLPLTKFKTKKLTSGSTYFWRVRACNVLGCTGSNWRRLTVK